MTVTIAARGPHVLISNTCYGLFGTAEELTDKQVDHIVSSECRKCFPIDTLGGMRPAIFA
jgi:hypothetical protein